MPSDILKVFIAPAIAFFTGISISPIFSHFAYKYKWWKKNGSKGEGLGGGATPIFDKLHGNTESEIKTPRMGGAIIWASVFLTAFFLYAVAHLIPSSFSYKVTFVSRNQTWLPLFTLLIGSVVGLWNDYKDIVTSSTGVSRGISLAKRVVLITILGLVCGWWFYAKLDVSSISLPLFGEVTLGLLIVPLFSIIMLGLYSGGIIDGIDGLSGGVFASIYGAYSIIAFFNHQIDLAAFCAAVVGAILAFLWFNIPPARFWMTETGTMALTITITAVAFLTNSIAVLPIIALPLVLTTLSSVIQVGSKKFRGKKVFLIAPLHHHFEAIGWPSYKVTMRYWIISVVCAIIGSVLALI